MDADVPKPSLPAQAGVRPKADAMGEQAATQDHQGHEITATIEGAAPADQHHDGAQKQKQKMPGLRPIPSHVDQHGQAQPQVGLVNGGLKQMAQKGLQPSWAVGHIVFLSGPMPNALHHARAMDAQKLQGLEAQAPGQQPLQTPHCHHQVQSLTH